MSSGHNFSEEVGKLVLWGYMWKRYNTREKTLPTEMTDNLNVLCLFMEHWIVDNLYSIGVICVELEW